MTTVIECDADMPTSLNTSTKQVKNARRLASLFTGIPAKKARAPELQGFYSRTVIITLQDGQDVVIQFRPEPLDIRIFKTARRVLGEVVPDIEIIKDEELERERIWIYRMTCVPGKTWLRAAPGRSPQARVVMVRSLGRILSKGYVDDGSSSGEIINSILRPHLSLLLSSEDAQIQRFQPVAQDLWTKLDTLQILPLFISHFDLNDVNILVDENSKVSGIVDWELSTPLPFGMGLCRIHTLAGEFTEKKFHMPPEFDEAERGFWEEIFEGVPLNVRELAYANPEVVQVAVTLGTLLDAFQLENGTIGPYNPVVIEALPKLLDCRIPLIRAGDSAYSN